MEKLVFYINIEKYGVDTFNDSGQGMEFLMDSSEDEENTENTSQLSVCFSSSDYIHDSTEPEYIPDGYEEMKQPQHSQLVKFLQCEKLPEKYKNDETFPDDPEMAYTDQEEIQRIIKSGKVKKLKITVEPVFEERN